MGKKNKKRERKQKENLKNAIITTSNLIILTTLVLIGAYFIFETDLLNPKVNEVTASYISLNNKDRTDMLKIGNLKSMSTSRGSSKKNKNYIDLNITGENKKEYNIILYPISNNTDLKYINFSLEGKNKKVLNSLNNVEKSSDGGIIIYNSKIGKNNKLKLRMWLSEDYNKKSDDTFEIKIK